MCLHIHICLCQHACANTPCMSSDEGWSEVFCDNEIIEVKQKDKFKKLNIKYAILKNTIEIFKEFENEVEVPKIDEYMEFNIISKMYYLLKSENQSEKNQYYFNDYKMNIKYFKFLKEHNIISRIYFIVEEEKIESFLEIYVNKVIIVNKQKYNGCCFYIDANNNIEDYSWYFSKYMRNYSCFLDVIQIFREVFGANEKNEDFLCIDNENKLISETNAIESFRNLDKKRLSEIPTNINKFKKHPIYCLESTLKFNQTMHKNKTLQGFYKGEPVYLRKHIINLKSKKYFYRMGKEILKCNEVLVEPLKITNGVGYYSVEQTKDTVIDDMCDGKFQDYLHPNHVPKNCVYLLNDYDEFICKKLNIEHRKCFVGFNKQSPVYKGIFVYKKDLFVVSNFIFEYYDYITKLQIEKKVKKIISNWEKITRICKKYKSLQNRL